MNAEGIWREEEKRDVFLSRRGGQAEETLEGSMGSGHTLHRKTLDGSN